MGCLLSLTKMQSQDEQAIPFFQFPFAVAILLYLLFSFAIAIVMVAQRGVVKALIIHALIKFWSI